MRYLLLLACLLLQVAWSDLLRIGLSAPDLLAIGLIWCCAAMPGHRAALVGFLAGLLLDLVAGLQPFGASALAGTSMAFFASRFLSPDLKLHLLRLLGRSMLILAPVELFLANLRYDGLDYLPIEIALYQALPVLVYTMGLLVLVFLLPGYRIRGGGS